MSASSRLWDPAFHTIPSSRQKAVVVELARRIREDLRWRKTHETDPLAALQRILPDFIKDAFAPYDKKEGHIPKAAVYFALTGLRAYHQYGKGLSDTLKVLVPDGYHGDKFWGQYFGMCKLIRLRLAISSPS